MNFTLVTALLYMFSSISVSLSEFHSVEVQRGEDVTLKCTNFTKMPSYVSWFRLSNEPNISRISSMLNPSRNTLLYDGFRSGRFNMTSNITTIFLHITQVDFSDTGLYFCGFYCDGNSIIVHATYLNLTQEKIELPNLTSVVLGGLIILLTLIISLMVKIKGFDETNNPQQRGTFKLKPFNTRASERELDTDAVYINTR